MQVQHPEDGVHDLAADVLEVHVDAVRAGLASAPSSRVVTVDRRVEAELVDEPRALVGAAGDPDDAAPRSFASWPATEPTAPAAAETTTVSPSSGLPISSIPKYAVTPVRPSSPSSALERRVEVRRQRHRERRLALARRARSPASRAGP